VPDAGLTDASDVSDDTVSQERAVLLVDRVSAAVTRQLEAMTVELAASRERIEALARENGTLAERVAGLERELSGVRQLSDDDRQRLIAELEVARAELQDLQAGERVSQAEQIGRLTAELTAERAAKSSLEARTASHGGDAPQEPAISRWRTWAPWLLAALAICASVALLAWPK
jgi:chromosome segregation ATPase